MTAAKACSPEIAEKLYKTFVDEIKSEVGKHGDVAAAQQANLKEKMARIQAGPVDPKEMFKIDDWAGQFSEYDDKGKLFSFDDFSNGIQIYGALKSSFLIG